MTMECLTLSDLWSHILIFSYGGLLGCLIMFIQNQRHSRSDVRRINVSAKLDTCCSSDESEDVSDNEPSNKQSTTAKMSSQCDSSDSDDEQTTKQHTTAKVLSEIDKKSQDALSRVAEADATIEALTNTLNGLLKIVKPGTPEIILPALNNSAKSNTRDDSTTVLRQVEEVIAAFKETSKEPVKSTVDSLLGVVATPGAIEITTSSARSTS